jgi:hypothetical protein
MAGIALTRTVEMSKTARNPRRSGGVVERAYRIEIDVEHGHD